ncbi:MAG: hypothetical protein QNJ94_16000 [Alphaproteobacteria bacterium]|nr:hypothetical protein [Alphaproteobacteria bacterium]
MSITRVIAPQLKNRRRDRRREHDPIEVKIEGEICACADWSLGGFQVNTFEGFVLPGTVLPITLIVTAGDHTLRHKVECQVVRMDPGRRTLAARFTTLPTDAVATLEGVQTGRFRRAQLRKFPSRKRGR